MRSKAGAALAALVLWVMAFVVPAHAAFPGANGKIAFDECGDPSCSSPRLFTVEPDGSATTQILGPYSSEPSWSPDGSKIAYTTVDGGLRSFFIAVVNADGTGMTAPNPPTGALQSDIQPAWSPDGKKIAFARLVREDEFPQYEIFVMNADGTDATRLTHEDPRAEILGSIEPAWAPDGKRIAFTRTVGSPTAITVQEVFVMNADGTNPIRLTHSDNGVSVPFAGGAEWSPDGSRIAYHQFREGGADIFTMKPDGSDVRPAVTNPRPDLFPAWSPDGTKLAYSGSQDGYGGYEILVSSLGSSDPTRLTFLQNSTFHASWQPRPPQRKDYKNAAQFCKAEREFLGDAAFAAKYGGGANAHGKCVSSSH
jgi:Tol biopolymer transport system component